MGNAAANPYDEVAYPGHAFAQTHPARLATIAHAHGMTCAPCAGMHVLELGCGHGANLVPMAAQHPTARFVGVDLSARAIDQARRMAAELGLANIAFEHRDIMAVSPDLGRFDYIIVHGVYSWVPEAVRERILAIFGGMLTPRGVAYLSYNALPGGRLRDLARDVMLHATREIADPAARVAAARLALKSAAEASDPDSFHGAALRMRLTQIDGIPDNVLIHDDLNPLARSFALHEVIADARKHGLQFLSEASFPTQFGAVGSPILKALEHIPSDRPVEREQGFDLLTGRLFRETLLCRADIGLNWSVGNFTLGDYHLSAAVRPARDRDDDRPGVEQFEFMKGVKLAVDLPQAKTALRRMGAASPGAIAHDVLVAQALGDAAGEVGPDPAREQARLDEALTVMFRAGLVEIHREPPLLTTVVGERPLASPVARWQARNGEVVTDLRHRAVRLNGGMMRRFLCLLDGSRDEAALLADMNAFVAAARAADADADADELPERVTAAEISAHLREMAGLALLCG